jgi:hypothetical protein
MLIRLSELPEALRKHVVTLRGFVSSALENFVGEHAPFRVKYCRRTEASIIHDYIIWHAKQASFPHQVKRNLFLLNVENDYRVKPKKLDSSLRPRNIQTNLVLEFERNRGLRLFDDLDLTHVFLGYQRDGVELLNSPIWLVCPQGRRVKWAVELPADMEAATVEVAVAPTIPQEPSERRIKPKKSAEEAKPDAAERG